MVGTPNSGKSTLFNRLTGLRQRTANYPGATVEKHIGVTQIGDTALELIDLPGTFSLSAHSMEERIAVDVVLGRMPGTNPPAGILAVVDITRLYQGLYLLQQLLDLERRQAELVQSIASMKQNQSSLSARLEQARLGREADTNTESVQFRVIDPPRVPINPSGPNRVLFSSAVKKL